MGCNAGWVAWATGNKDCTPESILAEAEDHLGTLYDYVSPLDMLRYAKLKQEILDG